jgi:hypothetical protein
MKNNKKLPECLLPFLSSACRASPTGGKKIKRETFALPAR